MVAICNTIEQVNTTLNTNKETNNLSHIVLHKNHANNIIEKFKSSCKVSSSGQNPNSNTKIISNQRNPLTNNPTGGKPQPKKRSMKRKKPKKKGAAARKTQMKIKQKKTRNKIKKQMRKTKRKR